MKRILLFLLIFTFSTSIYSLSKTIEESSDTKNIEIVEDKEPVSQGFYSELTLSPLLGRTIGKKSEGSAQEILSDSGLDFYPKLGVGSRIKIAFGWAKKDTLLDS